MANALSWTSQNYRENASDIAILQNFNLFYFNRAESKYFFLDNPGTHRIDMLCQFLLHSLFHLSYVVCDYVFEDAIFE